MKKIQFDYDKEEFDFACDYIAKRTYRKVMFLFVKAILLVTMGLISCAMLIVIMAHILKRLTIAPMYATDWWLWLIMFVAIETIVAFLGKTLSNNIDSDKFAQFKDLIPDEKENRKAVFIDKFTTLQENMGNQIFMLRKIFSQESDRDISMNIENDTATITYFDQGIEKDFSFNIDVITDNNADDNIVLLTPIYYAVVLSEKSDESLANCDEN